MAFMSMMLAVVVVVLLICAVIGIASYVMTSLSLYTIAKRRNINHAWLAWIPVASYWTLGSIADEYDERNGLKKRWAKTLVALYVIFYVAFIVVYVAALLTMYLGIRGTSDWEMQIANMVTPIIVLYLLLVAVMIFAMVFSVCYYISLYKIFESTVPKHSLLCMIISILVPLGLPICLMCCRKKGYSAEVEATETYTAETYTEPQPTEVVADVEAEVVNEEEPVADENE